MYDCPICRKKHAVGNADAHNLDQTLQSFMLLYFPKEIKEKRKENEQEQATIDKQNMRRPAAPRRLPITSSSSRSLITQTSTPSRDTSCNIM